MNTTNNTQFLHTPIPSFLCMRMRPRLTNPKQIKYMYVHRQNKIKRGRGGQGHTFLHLSLHDNVCCQDFTHILALLSILLAITPARPYTYTSGHMHLVSPIFTLHLSGPRTSPIFPSRVKAMVPFLPLPDMSPSTASEPSKPICAAMEVQICICSFDASPHLTLTCVSSPWIGHIVNPSC